MLCKLFWRTVRSTYPWLPLAKSLWCLVTTTGQARSRARMRAWHLYSRINFAELMAMAIDMAHPEYWV